MPYEEDDQRRVDEAVAQAGEERSTKLLVRDASESQKLGAVTVICMVLNRTIGSGIYVTPAIILKSTNSVGISLLLWAFGALIALSSLLVWLELGLSIPKFEVPDRISTYAGREGDSITRSVPRNGGEKNYLEYIYKLPKLRTTCVYGFVFVLLGNMSGNSIALGLYVMEAADIDEHPSAVRGVAIGSLTVACLLHASWRKGGIIVNNFLAIIKVLILLAVIIIGFAASAGARFGHGPVHGQTIDPATNHATSNLDTHSSFAHPRHDVAGYTTSILYILYTFSGYEQPFYVLSEVARPKKTFASSTITAMGFVAILFMLVNIAYLCAVSIDQRLDHNLDMATSFFKEVFGNQIAPRVMSGIIAMSIFGNIVVQTFTAARVKQEIAKEGVLPFSLFFARSSTTPYAWLRQRSWSPNSYQCQRSLPEQSPVAALFLHWCFAMVMIGATSSRIPQVAYGLLVSLYSWVLVAVIGFLVSTGLLYLRYNEGKKWTDNTGFRPWGGPTAAIIYSIVCAFVIIASFIPPSAGSALNKSRTGIEWYIVPTVGLCAIALGFVYYLGFHYVVPRIKKKVLVVAREAILVKEEGEWVQAVELVEASWIARPRPMSNSANGSHENHDMERMTVTMAK